MHNMSDGEKLYVEVMTRKYYRPQKQSRTSVDIYCIQC